MESFADDSLRRAILHCAAARMTVQSRRRRVARRVAFSPYAAAVLVTAFNISPSLLLVAFPSNDRLDANVRERAGRRRASAACVTLIRRAASASRYRPADRWPSRHSAGVASTSAVGRER